MVALRTTEAYSMLEPASARPRRRRTWRGHLQGSEYTWAIAFIIPYAAVFFAFVVYPVLYGIWLGRAPSL